MVGSVKTHERRPLRGGVAAEASVSECLCKLSEIGFRWRR